MISKFTSVLIIFQINFIYNYIVLPIGILHKENYILFNKQDSLKDIIFSEYYTSLFTELNIGTETQKIPLLIELRTNDFLITSIHKIENNASE